MHMDPDKLPQHIAIIMDGNGRWAQSKKLPRIEGHRQGSETVDEIVEACREIGIPYLTLYAFSMENWNRPKKEIDALGGTIEARRSDSTLIKIRLTPVGDRDTSISVRGGTWGDREKSELVHNAIRKEL